MDLWSDTLKPSGQFLLLVSAVLTLWSMCNYIKAALPSLLEQDKP
jgi:CDP-diacylglycerol--glycerol-3-phosphate 3-phosphatidyltransferase